MQKNLFHVAMRNLDAPQKRGWNVDGDIRNVQVDGCWCVIDFASGEQITYPYDRVYEISAVKVDVPDPAPAENENRADWDDRP